MNVTRSGLRMAVIFAVIAISWGGSYVALKVGLPYSRPFSYATMTTLIGGLALAVAAWSGTRTIPRDLYAHGLAFLLGLLNSSIFIGLLNLGLSAKGMDAGLGSILTYTQPLIVVILAMVFLRERPGRRRLVGVAIGFAGMAVALSSGMRLSVAPLWSYLCLLGASLGWAMGTIIYKRVHGRVDLLWNAALQGLYAAIPLGLIAYVAEGSVVVLNPTPIALLALAEMSLLSSGLAMGLYLYLLKHHAAIKVGAFIFVVPLTAVVLGVILLGERLTPLLALGAAGVLVGIYLANGETAETAQRESAEVAVPATAR